MSLAARRDIEHYLEELRVKEDDLEENKECGKIKGSGAGSRPLFLPLVCPKSCPLTL
jgi:hypothetical protein